MKLSIKILLFAISATISIIFNNTVFVLGGRPLSVQVTLRGKRYDVDDVSTVRELQTKMEVLSGLSSIKQSVLFDGRRLRADDDLEDSGISDGASINIVPTTKKKNTLGPSSARGTTSSSSSLMESNSPVTKEEKIATLQDNYGVDVTNNAAMERLLEQSGIDKDKLDDLMKSFPDGGAGGMAGGAGGGMPNIEESMKMMKDMVNNPLFQQYMTDPEKLEQSRQMILNNPIMSTMMKDVPGFSEVLHDKEKWRDTMIQAADMYKSMGPDVMEKMMSGMGMPGGLDGGGLGDLGGLGGLDGAPPMGGSASSAATQAALDELSEDDE